MCIKSFDISIVNIVLTLSESVELCLKLWNIVCNKYRVARMEDKQWNMKYAWSWVVVVVHQPMLHEAAAGDWTLKAQLALVDRHAVSHGSRQPCEMFADLWVTEPSLALRWTGAAGPEIDGYGQTPCTWTPAICQSHPKPCEMENYNLDWVF